MCANGADALYRAVNCFPTAHELLLKCALVFGANGSGKSNFIGAFSFMKEIVTAEISKQSLLISTAHAAHSFCFHEEAETKPMSFEACFLIDDVMYKYGFALSRGKVVQEHLYKKQQRRTEVFRRNGPSFGSISSGKDMKNVEHLKQNVREDTLFLSLSNFGNNELAMKIYEWFDRIQIFSADNIGAQLSTTVDYLEKDAKGKEKVLSLLQHADMNISNFEVDVTDEANLRKSPDSSVKRRAPDAMRDLLRKKSVNLIIKRPFYDASWTASGTAKTDISYESAGTRKLFEIAGPIVSALENGDIVLIDEIDARLHPVLVRNLVMMFNSLSQNPNHAQLICTTHDVLLLEEELRRDQIYLTEKDRRGVSTLYSLSDFKGVRKDSKLLKQYLLGAFGAVPKVRDYFT
ncbi:MAG: ATP-binding protein, partial [Oscillospiraceae bacterium]|nr:ATP-binding protein [Oscillospiraceae bacterium]